MGNTDEVFGLIVGTFIIFILVTAGVFSQVINGFVGAFGVGFGIILGGLICLMIVLAFLNIGRK